MPSQPRTQAWLEVVKFNVLAKNDAATPWRSSFASAALRYSNGSRGNRGRSEVSSLAVIRSLLQARYRSPKRVAEFNTAEPFRGVLSE